MTNKTISITCDSDNHAALVAFSNALREMAGICEPVITTQLPFDKRLDLLDKALSKETPESLAERLASYDTTTQQTQYPADQWVEMVHPDHNTTRMARSDAELEEMIAEGWSTQKLETLIDGQQPLGVDVGDLSDCYITNTPTLDKDGLPWDPRIHSTNKATVADGTWRLRRKPKDLTEEQWAAEIETVRAELKQLMAVGAGETGETAKFYWSHPESRSFGEVDSLEELHNMIDSDGLVQEISKEEFDVLSMRDVNVINEPDPVAVFAPPVPPVAVVPPAPPVAAVTPPAPPVAMTFPKLMTFLTERTGKITKEQIDQIVAKHGLTALTQFNQRPDLIGAFVADIKELLGE